MAVIVIEFIENTDTAGSDTSTASVINEVDSLAVVDVVRDGGTVNNVQWGYGLPGTAPDGTIWIDLS